jgi:hypothetical protein
MKSLLASVAEVGAAAPPNYNGSRADENSEEYKKKGRSKDEAMSKRTSTSTCLFFRCGIEWVQPDEEAERSNHTSK